MTDTNSEQEIRKAVRERYARLAEDRVNSVDSNCCKRNDDSNEDTGRMGGAGCCGGESTSDSSSLISISASIPSEASSINAGCGSPLMLVTPKEGDVVLDLGSGGGIDVFRASQLVGNTGRAIGVDATPEMLWRARETAKKYGDKYKNVEFRLGEIEHLPIESGKVDYVISNCVINLSPDKREVFNEAFRVLKPGGVFAVADVTVEGSVPESAREDMESWSSCLVGAISSSEYKNLLANAGFDNVEIEQLGEAPHQSQNKSGSFTFLSSHIKAKKPLLMT